MPAVVLSAVVPLPMVIGAPALLPSKTPSEKSAESAANSAPRRLGTAASHLSSEPRMRPRRYPSVPIDALVYVGITPRSEVAGAKP